jgi:CubicO group peptidase (beta-lactamase class C family)
MRNLNLLASSKLVRLLFIMLMFGTQLPITAQTLKLTKPEDVGLSSERLQKVHEAVQRHIDAGDIPGAVVLVARNGHVVYLDPQGVTDSDTKKPVQKDTAYWVASMTKPMVATCIMMLMEEGKLRLNDPVYRYIPEFKTTKVRVRKPGSPPLPTTLTGGGDASGYYDESQYYDFVPADRDITIRHLLTHTSGLMTIGVQNAAAPTPQPAQSIATWAAKLASTPTDFQPGTNWAYSNVAGFDVLARVVEVVSGMPFEQFIKQRLFEPLGMNNTSFYPIRPELKQRLATVTLRKTANGFEGGPDPIYINYVSGAAGSVSTVEDYWRFAEMLLNGGQSNGKRLLKPETVTMMTSNEVGDLFPGTSSGARYQKYGPRGMGFGFGVVTVTDAEAAGAAVSTGSFGWDGQGTTRFWVIPKEKMVVVMLVRPNGTLIHRDVEEAVMQSVVR